MARLVRNNELGRFEGGGDSIIGAAMAVCALWLVFLDDARVGQRSKAGFNDEREAAAESYPKLHSA